MWPCKINGCNKQFAREADLKRHQRTTKSHSMPGLCVSVIFYLYISVHAYTCSACPQCDATFTRVYLFIYFIFKKLANVSCLLDGCSTEASKIEVSPLIARDSFDIMTALRQT